VPLETSPSAPRAHAVRLGKVSVDQPAGDGLAPDPYSTRNLYLCDAEVDLPTATEFDVQNGDWAFALSEGTQWRRSAGSWTQVTGGVSDHGALTGLAAGDMLRLAPTRMGADASDTAADQIRFLGILVEYDV
jgi:hypothetical protein